MVRRDTTFDGLLELVVAEHHQVFGRDVGASLLDGGAYLVALAAPEPELLALPPAPAGLARALEDVRDRGQEIGLLRHERRLATPDDAAAYLADPLLGADVREALTTG